MEMTGRREEKDYIPGFTLTSVNKLVIFGHLIVPKYNIEKESYIASAHMPAYIHTLI